MISPEQIDGTDTTAPLQDWAKTPSLSELKQDVEEARPVHNAHVTKVNEWLDNLHVTGKAKANAPKGSSQIVPRLIRKQAEWRYAALSEPFLSTPDIFNVSPVSWEDKDAAVQNEMVLNWQFNTQLNKVTFIDEYVRTAVDEGTVIVKLGWESIEEQYMEDVPNYEYILDNKFAPQIGQLSQMQQTSPEEFEQGPEEMKTALQLSQQHGLPYRPNLTGYSQEPRTRLMVNRPTVEVCDYRNIIIDPTCQGDVSKAKFIAYTFESSIADLKRDGRYKNLDQINVTGNSALSEPDHAPSDNGANFTPFDRVRQKFVVHEYWGMLDIDGTGILKAVVCAWVGNVMIRMDKNPFPDQGLPFVIVQYLPVRKAIYGEPDGALLEDNQKIIGALTRGMIDIMGKSANGQTGVRKDMLDATNRRRFLNGEDYEFNPTVGDPRNGVFMHTFPEIPMSAQFLLQLQNMEAESLTGVKAYAGGISGDGLGDVAAGVRGALDAASKRELGILRRLSQGMVEIGRKIIAMNSEFLSEQEVIRITNGQFVQVKRDDLAGKFDLSLSISTAEEDNNKAEQLAFMLQTTGPNEDPGLRKMILSDICRLRKMPDLAQKIAEYQPQPDPVQQKVQQLEIAKMELEIAKMQVEATKIRAEVGLTEQKTNTEVAKQRNLEADSDQKDLNFVEQERGVTQERDLQKQGEQARANMALEVVKAHVKAKTEKKATVRK